MDDRNSCKNIQFPHIEEPINWGHPKNVTYLKYPERQRKSK